METTKIGVVGGGIQGLSLAYFLSKDPKYSVTLFERGKTLGGLLGLLKVGGTGLEGFYHHLSNHDADMLELVKELGLGDKIIYAESKVGVFHSNKIHPFSKPKDLLTFAPLGFLDRLRLGASILLARLISDHKRLAGITASSWLKKIGGEQSYKVVWEPLLAGKFGDHKDKISMAWMWSRLNWRSKSRAKGGEQLVYLRGGFGQIVEAMAKKIAERGGEIRTGVTITSVKDSGGKVAIRVGREKSVFDKVFVTTPINVFAKLTPDLPKEYLETLGKIRYRGAHVGVLVLSRPLIPGGYYWLNVNDRSIPLLAVIEHTNLAPKEDYGGSVVYLGNYPDPADPIMKLTDKKVLELYHEHLPKINPEFKPDWIKEAHIFKDDAAQPIVDTDYHKNIPAYATPIKNLYLVTMAQIYPDDRGTSNAVRQAKRAIASLGL